MDKRDRDTPLGQNQLGPDSKTFVAMGQNQMGRGAAPKRRDSPPPLRPTRECGDPLLSAIHGEATQALLDASREWETADVSAQLRGGLERIVGMVAQGMREIPPAEPLPGAPRFVIDERPGASDIDVAAAEVLRSEMQSRINALWSTPTPNLCPLRVQSSLEGYKRGLPTGDFLRAVLENDLNGAITRADDVNIHALPHIVAYVGEKLPAISWGSPDAVKRWLALKPMGASARRTDTPETEREG